MLTLIEKWRLFAFPVVCLIAVGFCGTISALIISYNVAFHQESGRLRQVAQSEAKLIETVGYFDQRNNNDTTRSPREITLSKLVEAHLNYEGFGETGEFVVAELRDDYIHFLLSHTESQLHDLPPIPLDHSTAEPMSRALQGKSGLMIGLDYKGKGVVAAYEYVDLLRIGIVAKIDLQEIRTPYIITAVLVTLLTVILISITIFAFNRTTTPLIKQIIEARRIALHASRAKSAFLANLSHEIRTPMVGIKSAIELLRSDLDGSSGNKEIWDGLENSSDVLLALLNDILDISKIEAGKMAISISPSHIGMDIENCMRLFTSSAQKKGLCLTCQSEIDHQYVAKVDSLRLKQILVNLLSNAIKFTQTGFVEVHAKVALLNHKTNLIVCVKDSGVGIKEEHRHKIFDAFSQAEDTTTKKFGGTGLGLTISNKLAGLMGGELKLESCVGEGSTFTLILPIEEAAIADEKVKISSILPVMTLLLAEDNPINQKVVKALLESKGHHVEIAFNGQEALDLAMQVKFDAILMDMQMPVMDGQTATRLIKQKSILNRDTPVFAFTADALKEHREQYFAAGVSNIIIKPFKWHDLEENFHKYCQFH